MSTAISLQSVGWPYSLPVQKMIAANTVKKIKRKALSSSASGTYLGAGRELIFFLRNVLSYLFSGVCTAFFSPLLSNCR